MADQIVELSGLTMKHKYAVPFGNQKSREKSRIIVPPNPSQENTLACRSMLKVVL